MKDTLYGEGAQHMLPHHSKSRHVYRVSFCYAVLAMLGILTDRVILTSSQRNDDRLFITHCRSCAMLLQDQ